jgi:hypothetical protein
MFAAFALVCAVTNYQIDYNRCAVFDDTWGPYTTRENCQIRADQMAQELTNGDLNYFAFMSLGFPEMINGRGFCETTEETQV